MSINLAWAKRNLGFDPIATRAPASTFAFAPAAVRSPKAEDLQREIIDFDRAAPRLPAAVAGRCRARRSCW